jgi:hypothetical protein
MRFGSNNLTTLVSLDAKGNMTRRGLFDKDEAEAYAIPKMSVQTSPNDLVIYFQRFGKRRFAKITF